MSNFNSFSAILGLVALGAMTSCSIKEDVSGCPKQQVIVDLRAFDYSMDDFGSVSGGPSTKASGMIATKAVEASEAVSQIAFKAFDASGEEIYSESQSSGDSGFGSIDFELAPGSYTFVAVGNKLSANAGADAMVSISSVSEATLPEALPTDVFSLTKAVTIEPRKDFTTAMTLPRVMSQFKLATIDKLPSNVASIELIGNSKASDGSGASGASFDPSDGRLLTDQLWTKTAIVSASAGKQPVTISLNMLLTSDEQSIDVVANAYDSSGNLITTISLNDVPMKRNRVTTARGTLFNAGGASSFTFENTWLDPYEMAF